MPKLPLGFIESCVFAYFLAPLPYKFSNFLHWITKSPLFLAQDSTYGDPYTEYLYNYKYISS